MTTDRFRLERLERLARIERRHFWFAARRALVARMVERHFPAAPARVLDAGCGTGATLEWLTSLGYRTVGFDLRPEGPRAARQVCDGAVFQADAARLPLAPASLDAAIALDVLEHVDDAAMLADLVRALRPGAPLLLTVPALPWLWSYRDEDAGHLRRYTAASLRGVLHAAGLEVDSVRYYQCLLLPLVVLTRWLGRRDPRWRDREDLPAPFVNRILTGISLAEVASLGLFRMPIGSSLVALCHTINPIV